MNKLPFYLGFIFIAITIHRIAIFAGNNLVSWTLAIGLAAGVYCSAYSVDNDGKTNKRALTVLIFFTLVDGFFNFAETIKWSIEIGRWDFAMRYGDKEFYIYRIADFILGIFPTLAAAGLAWMARSLELKRRKSVGIKARLQEGFAQYLLNMLPEAEQAKQSESIIASPKQKSEAVQIAQAFLCQECEKEFATVQALSAHKRFCASKISINGANHV